MNKNKSAAQIFSQKEINRFLTRGIEECGKDFKRVREELLNICDNEANPTKQWNKTRTLLLNNIVSQIPILKSTSNLIRQKIQKRTGHKREVRKPEPWVILTNILDNESYLYECIKIVAVLNAYENPQRLLPNGVMLVKTEDFNSDSYYLRHKKIRIYLSLKAGEQTSFDIEESEYNGLKNPFSLLMFEYRSKRNYLYIKHSDFYEYLTREFSHITDFNKMSPLNKPSKNLNILHSSHQQTVLRKYTESGIDKYKWLSESELILDENALYKFVFASLGIEQSEVENLYVRKYPIWEPNILHLNPSLMSYQLADDYIRTLPNSEQKRCLIQCTSELGFSLFNVKSFRETFNKWRAENYEKELRAIERSISHFYTRPEIKLGETQKKYWCLYLDVNRLKKLGFKKKEAYEKLRTKYKKMIRKKYEKMSSNSICARYKEKAVEANKSKLSDTDIIRKFGLYEFEEVLSSKYMKLL